MDSVLARPPSTPTRAKSAGPCRPHRDPMEDADSSSTRKRPRLDSGDRAYRSMSVDRFNTTPSDAELPDAPEAPSDSQHPSAPSETTNALPPMSLTPSKVTINVREPPGNSSPPRPPSKANGASILRGGSGGDEPLSSQQDASGMLNSPSSNVISVHSSPRHSPEIEVAEVEDMNDEPAETRWKPLASAASAIEAKETQRALLDNFPYLGERGRSLRKTVTALALALEKNDLEDSEILDTLANWIELYLQTTESHSTQWWDMYLDERDFWDIFPSLADAVLHRNNTRLATIKMMYSSSGEVSTRTNPLQNFLVAYTSLAIRVAQIDVRTLDENEEDASATPDIFSQPYLVSLLNLMSYEFTFWKCLVEATRYDGKTAIAAMINRFILPPQNGISCMTQISKSLLERCQTSPSLAHKVWVQINIVTRLVRHYRLLQCSDAEVHKALLPPLQGLPCQAYQFFMAINNKFYTLISKQVSALSIEASQGLVSHLSQLIQYISQADEQLTRKIITEDLVLVQDFACEDGPILVELSWKFELLKKCILEGRMEIRVQGVETMQTELVSVYTHYIQNSTAQRDHPIAQFLSDFMLANKLVEYLVGVESHPQLINRCANIVGFLVVTSRYTKAESDVIWKAVTTSQDPRFVDAMLHMLTGIFNIASYPILLYLTTKLNELPVDAFDGNMVTYGRSLLDNLRQKWRLTHSDQRMEMPPYHLCIRLIRQSAAASSVDPQRKREVHNFAILELRHLLPLGPGDADKTTIYQECIEDISNRTDFATGSISAINAVLAQNSEREIASLAKESDLTSLVVGEFAHMMKLERSSNASSQLFDERLNIRLHLLQLIIVFVPDSLTADVGTQLWDVAVGSQALHDQARESAWMCFIRAIRSSQNRNAFIDQCIKDHLPRLHPRFYTMGCLSFVQDVVYYHARVAPSRSEDDLKQEPTAGELLWQLSLTAPAGTIAHKAITDLVSSYLDSPDIQHITRAETEFVHTEVVGRCIRQLTSAAAKLRSFSDGTSSGEDEPMVIVASEDEVQTQRLSFSRSLMILKEFVAGVRSRPRYSPQPQSRPQLPQDLGEIKGELIRILYQSFSGGNSTDIRTMEIGDLETIHDLSRRLISLTGFPKFTTIAGGQILNFKTIADQTLRDLKFDQKGLLIVRRAVDAEPVPDLSPASGLRPVEVEILAHFSELYQLLGMEEKFAKEVYGFLIAFSPHKSITALVCSKDTPLETTFPSAAPFKILYSVFALRLCLKHQKQNGIATADLVSHGIRSVTTTLTTSSLHVGSHGAEVDTTVAYGLTDCLVAFLDEPISPEGATSMFRDPSALVDRLLSLIAEALVVTNSLEAETLPCRCFAAILEASMYSESLWNHFKNADKSSAVLRRLLLEETREEIRKKVGRSITDICHRLHTIQPAPAHDIVPFLWQNITTLISDCLNHRHTAKQFFEVATVVFHSTDPAYRETLEFPTYIRNWSALLLQHVHDEFPGRDEKDYIVHGLSSLLRWCFLMSKSLGKPLNIPDNLIGDLFHSHLFPEIPNPVDGAPVKIRIPNLHMDTRQELYAIILVLSNDMGVYQKLLMLVRDLLSQGEDSQAWSWGIAQVLEEYHYEINWNFERAKCIRSFTGYPGLRNLSNTCYMNSLFTQLFMNVRFREFMLNVNIADSISSQRLLYETQNLFGFMQDSMLKSVDSQGIVDSLVTYDNTLIDVSIQMDVDEFYNLLFDRWESQILSGADKKTFRAFYGGQIVQQIKSKECHHISERLEPFSAIQCDIHGKTTLVDSLNAYVEGEVMEGDNKYSCTSCGRYVDAVKRACLKDIPNNLIFHLKRFDYDVMTGTRSKINENFEFPEQIDMSPYHVNYLQDPEQPPIPDVFELVGVLVHSGTAESGHYYSYIRERPPVSVSGTKWIEFNDADVTKFEPQLIPDQCFGGFSDQSPYASRYMKVWNAYMLFYERIEAKVSSHDEFPSTSVGIPAKTALPVEVANRIAIHNAQWLRTYCLFDPTHAAFARQLLEQLRSVNKGTCSEDHAIEKDAIWLSLDHLDRVLSRTKDCSDFGKMLASVTKVIGSCSTCCKLALDWVAAYENPLRNLLLRCPTQKVRKDFAGMIIIALQYLRKNEPQWYGFDELDDIDVDSSDNEMRQTGGIFVTIAGRLKELWHYLPQHLRGWDDYFGLLVEMAHFGAHENHVLLNMGFLQGCLEFLVVEHHHKTSRLRNDNTHYANYVRHLEKGRRFSLNKLIELVASLLARISLQAQPVRNFHERRFQKKGMELTKREDEYMHLGNDIPRTKSCCIFLEKILNTGSNPQATKKIIQAMVLAEPDFNQLEHVQKTITNGINVDPASLAAPFLRAALTFCECVPSLHIAQSVIQFIAGEVDTIGLNGGREHLEFFVQARRIQNLRNIRSHNNFNRFVLRAVPQWAPALIMYWDEGVRNGTIDLLRVLVFGHDIKAMDDEQEADLIETAGKDLCGACVRRCNSIVQQQKTIDGKTVEQVMMVIKHCLTTYWTSEEDQRPVIEAESVLGNLEALTVSDVDEVASDTWNNASDDGPTDSDSENFMTSP